MDLNRIQQLAGISNTEQQLLEVVDTSSMKTIEDVSKRLDACKRALSIANKLRDVKDRKKWLSSTFVNLNKIRAVLKRLIDEAE